VQSIGTAPKTRGAILDIIISNASDKPIYEQIVSQIKDLILSGELEQGSMLPSIRNLASDLRISVITTKRAYSELEAQGFIETVQGKGSFVAGGNMELLREERLRHVEELLGKASREAQSAGISLQELHDMLDLMAGE
jgi:GntR family transcriptional regulator